ncbi:MAG: RidA family protein [Acidobacteriota bacterium]|nr:RidA family protein [Blastocatellia bacterium]MDW8413659.1 RidA family protein [Acidobacteriota bacterium]
MDTFKIINPQQWPQPRGYNNGLLTITEGRLLFVAGQIGWDSRKHLDEKFCRQFERALENVLTVVRDAGGSAENIARLTIFVTDKQEYLQQLKEVGAAYKRLMGKHFPAMSLLEVKSLLEPNAKVEIEATAVIPYGKS